MNDLKLAEKKAKELLNSGYREQPAPQRAKTPTMEMCAQEPNVRNKNFDEVALGFTQSQAVAEALRCLNCPTMPCVKACPVNIQIPKFLEQVAAENFDGALDIIEESSILSRICGRVCPQEKQCQGSCTVGKLNKNVEQSVAIGRVERFVGDWGCEHRTNKKVKIDSKLKGKKVAVIGTGPSGLACAVDLRKTGAEVDIYESLHKEGGVLVYGIPEFRLPKSIVESEVKKLSSLGVNIIKNFFVGKTESVDDWLKNKKYDALFLGFGAGLPNFLGIPGEALVGVFSANEYLTRVNLMKAWDKKNARTPIWRGKKVVVFGAGNVAMDASRTALRLGATEVSIIYRRTMEEVPARREEVHHAMEEGVKFVLLSSPKEIMGDENGRVKAVKVAKCELGEADKSGRRRPVEIPNKFDIIECDTVIEAIGNSSNPIIRDTFKCVEFTEKGTIKTCEGSLRTSNEKIWAGGDVVTGAATVISAMGQGREAAREMIEYLTSSK